MNGKQIWNWNIENSILNRKFDIGYVETGFSKDVLEIKNKYPATTLSKYLSLTNI